jgi:hypothetical protein
MPDSDESWMKIESDLHGDMQKPAEMSGSHSVRCGATTVSEIPCRVSSDLHEWRNDRATVLTSDSANL